MLAGGVDPVRSREVRSTLSKVASVIGGTFQHSVDPEQTVDFVVTVGAMSAGGFTTRMKEFPAERLLVVSGDRPTIQLAGSGNGRPRDGCYRRLSALQRLDAIGRSSRRRDHQQPLRHRDDDDANQGGAEDRVHHRYRLRDLTGEDAGGNGSSTGFPVVANDLSDRRCRQVGGRPQQERLGQSTENRDRLGRPQRTFASRSRCRGC